MNFTALARVRTECENVAISVNSGLLSTFMGDCRSRAIQGRACDWADFVALCVDHTTVPSGKLIVRGCEADLMFFVGVPFNTKIEIAPVSAIGMCWWYFWLLWLHYYATHLVLLVYVRCDDLQRQNHTKNIHSNSHTS